MVADAVYVIFLRLAPAFTANLARPGVMEVVKLAAAEGRAPAVAELTALGVPEDFARLFAERLAYLIALRVQGILVSAGPFADLTEGIYVCRADSEASARRVIAEDPLYRAGFIEPDVVIRRWLAAI